MTSDSLVKSDLGFQYTDALCKAIELYTSRAENENASSFTYGRASLVFAVQRYLYFTLASSETLFRLFVSLRDGHSPAAVHVRSELERDVAMCLNESAPKQTFKVNRTLPARLSPLIRKQFRSVKGSLQALQSSLRPSVAPSTQSPGVLIHVTQSKFVRYLKLVTDRLPIPYSYLLGMNHDPLKAYLLKEGEPFFDGGRLPNEPLPKSSRLSSFEPLTRLFDYFITALRKARPQCVFLIEGNAPDDEVMNQACKTLTIPVICLQQGWSPIVHVGFRHMSYTKMLVWGEGFTQLLKPYNTAQTFVSVGHPWIQHVDQNISPGICFFLQALPSRIISEKAWHTFLEFSQWTAREFPALQIWIREHPGYPLPDQDRAALMRYSNIRLASRAEYSLMDLFRLSQLTVSICSSTILESIAAGVPPLIFNLTSAESYFPDVQAAEAGVEVKTVKDAQAAIRRFLTEPNYLQDLKSKMENFRQEFFTHHDTPATDRIVQEIMSVCAAVPHSV